MKAIFTLIIIIFSTLTLSAQHIKKVCGEDTYYAGPNESVVEAKSKALEKAKMAALANTFGTVISQSTTLSESSDDGKEHSFFSQYSKSEVEGEWIEDIADPKYTVSLINDELVVKCSVCGRARKYTNNAAEFEALVLRNHPEKKDASVNFKNNDDMFLYFSAPSDGYIAIYLVDETPTAYCLLPYQNDSDGQHRVKGGKEYIFFSPNNATIEEQDVVDNYYMTCNDDIERNKIYIIFSQNPFTKAVDHIAKENLPRELSYADFQHWLGKLRAHDQKIGVKSMRIEIRP